MTIRLTRTTLVFAGFIIIGGYFLISEHSAHLAVALPYLPYLLLLVCPLLHVFLHRGHGHHHRTDADGSEEQKKASSVEDEDPPAAARVPRTGARNG